MQYIVEVYSTDPFGADTPLLARFLFEGTEQEAYEAGWSNADGHACPTEVYVFEGEHND